MLGYCRLIVLTSGRTGSSWLTQALNSHPQIVCFGSVFGASTDFVSFDVDGYDNFSTQDQALRERDVQKFLQERIFCDHGSDVRAVGFKLQYKNVYGYPSLLDHLTADRELRVVHLQRRNLLRSFISLQLAETTGQYHRQPLRLGWRRLLTGLRHPERAIERLRTRLATRSYTPPSLRLAKEDCEQFIQRTRWSQGHYNKRFSAQEGMGILYEEMVKDAQSAFGRVQEFLGVERRALSYSQQPLNVAPMRDLLANYDELREALRDTQYAWMFD